MPLNFLKSLDADDIFISYSRRDGSAYLTGLDAALSKQGFSCFTDKRGTDAGRLPPETLYRKVRACKTLVLLASPGAQERPENITPELEKFAEHNGTSRIICVSFDGGAAFDDFPAGWEPFVVGKAREREAAEALTTGKPSEAVVAAVVAASDYMKSKDRLRKYRNRAIGLLAMLLLLSAGAASVAWYQLGRAAAATAKANEATAKADAETARAAQATQDAQAAQEEAKKQKDEAKRQKDEADKQKEIADLATKDALEKTKRADAATRRAEVASARADREQTIAEARALANRSQTVLRQRPEDLPRSLEYAADSMKKFLTLGVHGVEADTALRESLALFPRLRGSRDYPAGSTETPAALSPDGLHFATLSDNRLRVFEADGRKQVAEVQCECETVALSSGAVYAAAVVRGDAVKVFGLGKDAGAVDAGRLFTFEDGVIPERVALSPGGHYLAIQTRTRGKVGMPSGFRMVSVDDGGVVRSYSGGDLNMEIYDVAFGPRGAFALGGDYTPPRGRGSVGRALLWALPPETPGGPRPKLTAASFDSPEVFQQQGTVRAIAPGADMTYFATNAGVWRRLPGQAKYETVARLPYARDLKSTSSISMMAFDADGVRLRLVRRVEYQDSEHVGQTETALEVWDAARHTELISAPQLVSVKGVGFKPGGQFYAVMTNEFVSEGTADTTSVLHVYRTSDGEEVREDRLVLQGKGSPFLADLNSGLLVSVGKGFVQVQNLWDGSKASGTLGSALHSVGTVALGSGGKFLAVHGHDAHGVSATVVVYRLEGGSYREWKSIPEQPDEVTMSLSADGRRLAISSLSRVRVWDVADVCDVSPEGLKSLDIPLESSGRWGVALSPGGRFLVMTDAEQRTWQFDLSRGGKRGLLLGGTDVSSGLASVAFSPDDRYIGLGSEEGFLHVFDANGAQGLTEVARLPHASGVALAAFSDDGRYVLTSSGVLTENPIFRVWPLRPEELLAEAEARAKELSTPDH